MKIFRTWTFKWWEVSLIKVCLISLGILLGLYFYNYLVGLLWLWWALFAAFAIYFVVRFIQVYTEGIINNNSFTLLSS
jgi:prepilin signal peptidase PulO-like enzyme (type II secretory pathway)